MHRELDQFGKGQDGPRHETVRDYVIAGRDAKTGKWTILCNVTGNYQRKRTHALPCPVEPPGPPPPPAPPAIAPGAVLANVCQGMTAPKQMWTIDSTSGEVSTSDQHGNGDSLGALDS